ncbi:TetR family transcriptional regulator [Streptomyces sp. NEAU-W12]|uniref:TetR family transcriptional regulator n=1 Tax=Streptomyces sp. NEAU-W12 TaxID=2994668 RepID=UPI00224B32D5|nr:TetR family transcriptional regulator [Streptomyces sp. NEAU-W12]MCX2923795.1 TetR family transcriptional regulator [Streptomyces sp. NEAU-W12]
MSHTLGARQAQKQRTRRALLDAALGLLEEQGLGSLGLREVTRAAGVAPTAFYRHFRSIEDLGVALVGEALESLHPLIGTAMATSGDAEERITRAVELIAGHVDQHPAHMRFIVRERHGGVQAVREAIHDQLARFTEEVAKALAGDPVSAGWSEDDLLMLAQLYVDQMIATGCLFLEAPASATATDPGERGGARTRERVALMAARRLRLISIGRLHWLDRPADASTPGGDAPGDGTRGGGAAG